MFVRMLDDFGHELEMTDSKLQQVALKVEKVLRLSDGKNTFVSYSYSNVIHESLHTKHFVYLHSGKGKLTMLHLES